MTALGIDATDREPTIGWEAIQLKPKADPITVIRDRVEKAWKEYYNLVDAFEIGAFSFDEIQVALENARSLENRLHKLYNCQRGEHEWVTYTTGGMYYSGGDVFDNLHDETVCQVCGIKQEDNNG